MLLCKHTHIFLSTSLKPIHASALTDPLISGIAKGSQAYKLVGSYVSTPLNWSVNLLPHPVVGPNALPGLRAVITGKDTPYKTISDLKGTTLGISRPGR